MDEARVRWVGRKEMQGKMHDDYMQRKPLSRSTRRMSFKEARFETPSKDEVAMKKVSSYSQGEEGAEGGWWGMAVLRYFPEPRPPSPLFNVDYARDEIFSPTPQH